MLADLLRHILRRIHKALGYVPDPEDPGVDFMRISSRGSFVVLKNGEILPITTAFDLDGDECDVQDAVTVVAGPSKNGGWYSLDMTGWTTGGPLH